MVRPDRHHHCARSLHFWKNLSHALSSNGKEKLQLPGVGEADLTFEAWQSPESDRIPWGCGVGGARGRALGPWGRGSAPSSGGRGCGPGPLAATSRRRPQPGERGRSEARAVGPPRARPRSPVPPASPPCPASTTSSWRSPSGGCCAHCAGSPCASLCRCLLAATASATPACRSSSGATPGAVGFGAGGEGTARGRARARDTSGLCLRGRPVTSGAPTMMSRGGSDVRALGRTPRTQA